MGKTFSIWKWHKKWIHGKVVESNYLSTTNRTFEVKTSVIQSDASLTTIIVYSWKFSIHNICIGKGIDQQDKSPDELDAWLALNLGFCFKASIFRILLIWDPHFKTSLSRDDWELTVCFMSEITVNQNWRLVKPNHF